MPQDRFKSVHTMENVRGTAHMEVYGADFLRENASTKVPPIKLSQVYPLRRPLLGMPKPPSQTVNSMDFSAQQRRDPAYYPNSKHKRFTVAFQEQ